MPQTTLTSREFNQDTGRAKRAARRGVVVIMDRGRPSHVLMSYGQYQALAGGEGGIVDRLAIADAAPDFKPKRLSLRLKPARLK
jgi:hypothetical protein